MLKSSAGKETGCSPNLSGSSTITLKGDRAEPDALARRNGVYVEGLSRTVRYEADALTYAPRALCELLKEDAWRHFASPETHEVFDYSEREFDKFVRAKIPAGLAIEDGVAGLIRVCVAHKGTDAEDALRLIRRLVPAEGPHGGVREARAEQGDNVTLPRGNSETYFLRRLKRDRPELAAQVVAGEKSAHAAALEAGIRKQMAQHPATVDGFIRAAKRHLSPEERQQLREALRDHG